MLAKREMIVAGVLDGWPHGFGGEGQWGSEFYAFI